MRKRTLEIQRKILCTDPDFFHGEWRGPWDIQGWGGGGGPSHILGNFTL